MQINLIIEHAAMENRIPFNTNKYQLKDYNEEQPNLDFYPTGSIALRSQIWLCKTTQDVSSNHPVFESIDATSSIVSMFGFIKHLSPKGKLWIVLSCLILIIFLVHWHFAWRHFASGHFTLRYLKKNRLFGKKISAILCIFRCYAKHYLNESCLVFET